MVSPAIVLTISLLLASIAYGQDPIDWKKQFELGADREEAVRARSRESGEKIIDRVCQERLDQARVDIQAVSPFLLDPRADVQVQASGMLFLLTVCRPGDSGNLLSSSIQALKAAALDETRGDQQRWNCVEALAALRPSIPSDLFEFFRNVFSENRSRLMEPAAFGLGRLISTNAGASSYLHKYLVEPPHPDERSEVVGGIGASQMTNETILRDLGGLLGQKDPQLASEALRAISLLGRRAIDLNEKQLEDFASKTPDALSASLAKSLLKRK